MDEEWKDGRQTEKQLRAGELLEIGSSEVLDRVQSFLPQMAAANEKLSKETEACPAGNYDIENVGDKEKIIEMDVALVELNNSDSSEEVEESSSDESSDSDPEDEVTEHNIRLSQNREKAKIEVLI